MKARLTILKNETSDSHVPWIKACEEMAAKVSYDVIDLSKADWLHQLTTSTSDYYLSRPPGHTEHFKTLYDERLYIISAVLGKRIYPYLLENLLFENKRMMAYWLSAKGISHPKTIISYNYDEAVISAKELGFPIVGKTPIGAGGSGVVILHNQKELLEYAHEVFHGAGVKRTWGPNLRKGDIFNRVFSRLSNPMEAIRYFSYKKRISTKKPHKDHVILQEFISSEFEWRTVRIGESYFGHKKLKGSGDLFSGTSIVSWDYPDSRLLDFVKDVTDQGGFASMAVDIFQDQQGKLYVNELQCFFGSKNPHQMIVEDKPGRFINENGLWVFEEGEFNTNNSYNLRLKHVLKLIEIEADLCEL